MTDPQPGAKADAARWPVEIRLKQAEKVLEIDFDDGRGFSFAAEFLRVHSPSAEVTGHGPGQRVIVAGRRHVGIMELVPVGNYAVQIKFDDLHDTGIFSWDYFYHLGEIQDELWRQYLDDLEAEGLGRDP
jgi:DUF971 family protein